MSRKNNKKFFVPLRLTPAQARKAYDRWVDAWPEVAVWLKRVAPRSLEAAVKFNKHAGKGI